MIPTAASKRPPRASANAAPSPKRQRVNPSLAKRTEIEQPPTWDDAARRFIKKLTDEDGSAHTARNYRDDLRLFALWYQTENSEPPELGVLMHTDLIAWKKHLIKPDAKPLIQILRQTGPARAARSHSPSTVNRKLSALRSFLRWAEAKGWCAPIGVPRSVRQEARPPDWLDRKARNALLRAVEREGNSRDRALIRVMLFCGLRIAEAASLTWGAIQIGQRVGSSELTIVGKGRKHRTIPLNSEVRHALERLALEMGSANTTGEAPVFVGRRGGLSANGLWRIITRYGAAAGLGDLHPHRLRHTFCRMLAEHGNGIETIANLAGHESILVTRRYIEPGREDLAAAVESICDGEEE